MVSPTALPECWGHRGASAAYPENTLASFSAAILDGAEGIESDVHVSKDNVVIMFHDPSLGRTTNTTGLIREKNWYGDMEHVRTTKRGSDGKAQPIPTFAATVDLLMQESHKHVKFNVSESTEPGPSISTIVVDVKVQNEPDRLFTLMRDVITAQPNWETELAPRIILGLWHPKFIVPAKKYLPSIQLSHIGMSPRVAREFFWESCDAFSLSFPSLLSAGGEKFRRECKAAGKKIMVWTVNRREEMIEAVRWGVNAILTDVTQDWLVLRSELQRDYTKASSGSRWFLWTRLDYYYIIQFKKWADQHSHLEKVGGRFQKVLGTLELPPSSLIS